MNLSPPKRLVTVLAIVFVVAFDLAFCWQMLTGAYTSEFAGNSQESAHFLNGVAVRDLIAEGKILEPRQFLGNYRWHYPTVRVSEFPVFQVVEGAWLLAFGVNRTSPLLLVATIAAASATLVFYVLRSTALGIWAYVVPCMFLSLTIVRNAYVNIGPDLLCSSLVIAFAIIYARTLRSATVKRALMAGLLGGLAVLAGANVATVAVGLVLAPVFSNRAVAFRAMPLWITVGSCVSIIGIAAIVHPAFRGALVRPAVAAVPAALSGAYHSLGAILLLLGIVGACVILRRSAERPEAWASLGGLLIGSVCLPPVAGTPGWGANLLVMCTVTLLFTAPALALIVHTDQGAEERPLKFRRVRLGFALLAAIVGTAAVSLPIQTKEFHGFRTIAESIARGAKPGETVFISSDSLGEGAFLAEYAMKDPRRPSYSVHFASDLFGGGTRGDQSHVPIETEQEVVSLLRRTNVRFMIRDDSVHRPIGDSGDIALREGITNRPDNFWPLLDGDIARDGQVRPGAIRVYRIEHLWDPQ